MSEPASSGPTARPRPSTVTIASYLLYLAAAMIVVSSVVSLTTLGTVSTIFREEYAGTAVEGAEGFAVGFTVFSVVLQLLIAIGLVVLALLNNQGRNGARIATWVVAGVGVCCVGLGAAGTALSGVGTGTSTADGPDNAEIQRRLEAELPSWSAPLTTICSIIALLALIAAIILLALPASNEFFRKQPAGWEPPVPGATYPGQQPPYPGQSQASGTDPGYPQYPSTEPPSNPPGNPPSNPSGNPPS